MKLFVAYITAFCYLCGAKSAVAVDAVKCNSISMKLEVLEPTELLVPSANSSSTDVRVVASEAGSDKDTKISIVGPALAPMDAYGSSADISCSPEGVLVTIHLFHNRSIVCSTCGFRRPRIDLRTDVHDPEIKIVGQWLLSGENNVPLDKDATRSFKFPLMFSETVHLRPGGQP